MLAPNPLHCRRASDTGIHLIKNEGSDGVGRSQDHFHSQHDAGQFAT